MLFPGILKMGCAVFQANKSTRKIAFLNMDLTQKHPSWIPRQKGENDELGRGQERGTSFKGGPKARFFLASVKFKSK